MHRKNQKHRYIYTHHFFLRNYTHLYSVFSHNKAARCRYFQGRISSSCPLWILVGQSTFKAVEGTFSTFMVSFEQFHNNWIFLYALYFDFIIDCKHGLRWILLAQYICTVIKRYCPFFTHLFPLYSKLVTKLLVFVFNDGRMISNTPSHTICQILPRLVEAVNVTMSSTDDSALKKAFLEKVSILICPHYSSIYDYN